MFYWQFEDLDGMLIVTWACLDVCINDNGNAISFVQFEKAYTVSSVEKRSKGTYNEVKEANEHITGIMQSVFVPADGKSLSSCIRDGIDQPLLEIKRAICKTIKELLIPQPI
ncbi:hypothetical protein BDF19DRAFT_414896 [Syncephalis fuscata]|nr:hypothetical protein BDF19DRAFT_414896 [Syncephalis fuscata]